MRALSSSRGGLPSLRYYPMVSIAFGGIAAVLFRGANLLISFGLIILTSRVLEREDAGRFVFGIVVVGIIAAATNGLTAATAYQVSNQRRSTAEVTANGAAIALPIALVALLVGIAAGPVLRGDYQDDALPIALAAAAVALNSVIAGVFLGRESLIRYNLALVVPPMFALTAIAAVFAAGERTPTAALWMYAAGWWAALILLVATGRLLGGGRPTVQRVLTFAILRFAVLAGTASAISFFNYRGPVFVVDHFEGKAAVAVYSYAVYIAESVWQVSGSLALVTYARLGSSTRSEAAALAVRIMRHTVVLLGILCAILFAAADVIQEIVFPKYEGMATALRILLPGVFIYGLSQAYSGFYIYQRGMPWMVSAVAGTALVINIGLALLLVPELGINGAAWASAIGYAVAIVVALAFFLRSERLSPFAPFAIGRTEFEDYRSLIRRLVALARGERAPAPIDDT
jgi:O-antigen/teichoic acid export membrane protein